MSRRIDKVELIHLPILRLIVERDALRLDGDTAFALQIHGVQNLASISRSDRPPQSWMIRSDSVDLPWSMCAIMEKLRMFFIINIYA